MAEINWSLARTPDFAGNALEAYDLGREARTDRVKKNALALYGTDKAAGIKAISGVDPELGYKLQKQQQEAGDRDTRIKAAQSLAAGDYKGAKTAYADVGDTDQISKMDVQQREAAMRAAQEVGKVALELKALPPEARKQALSNPEMQAYLGQRGLTPDKLAAFDPSDMNLDRFIGEAQTFQEKLAQGDKDREFALKKSDSEADNSRADRKTEWDMKHGDRMAGIAGQNAGTSAYSAKTGRLSYDARKAAGGFGTPGAGGNWEEF